MKRNIIETVLGAIVLIIAGGFLFYSMSATDVGEVEGYEISANFNEIGALNQGDDVRIGGVKVGTVDRIELDGVTYRARVVMSILDDVALPTDTAARISNESLMGGAYLALDPGGDDNNIRKGGTVQYTQDAQNLESLLGKFIFSMSKSKDSEPAPVPTTAQAQTAPEAVPTTVPAVIQPSPAPVITPAGNNDMILQGGPITLPEAIIIPDGQ